MKSYASLYLRFVVILFLFGCHEASKTPLTVGDTLEVDLAASTACLQNSVNAASLVGSCGVKPAALPGLLGGLNYVSPTDLVQGSYETFLYNGSNLAPGFHQEIGDSLAQVIRATGTVKVKCYGMSNAKLIFDALAVLAAQSTLDNPNVIFSVAAESGCDLSCWISKGGLPLDAEVDVILLYHSNNKPQSASCTSAKRFPAHAIATRDQLEIFHGYLRAAHPNAKQIIVSSREFGGWSCPPSGKKYLEPVAFEEGFSVKWYVDFHLYDDEFWVRWGPYTWRSDTARSLFRSDGAHPCDSGAIHFAQIWFENLLTDSSSRGWFAASN